MTYRTALVTGASRGFGYAVAEALVRRGWALTFDARTESDIEEAAARLRTLASAPVRAIAGDVTDSDHAGLLVASAARRHGLDLLVNNASELGPSPLPRLADYQIDRLRTVVEVNVMAPLRLVQLALPDLRRARGTIVNVSSDAAVEGYGGWGGYGASKAALEQLSRVLAVEEPEVRVLLIDPGDMNTRMHQDAFPGEDISDRPLPEERIPALASLLDSDSPSGRYRLTDVLTGSAS